MPIHPSAITAIRLGALCAAASITGCAGHPKAESLKTATPIKHLVIIFSENISFDHYFATYPVAQNPPGEPAFTAEPGTPAVNGLSGDLLTRNGNFTNTINGKVASNPFRIDRSQAATSDQSHYYTAEQLAFDGGAADRFPSFTGQGMPGGTGAFSTPAVVMGYYDGNTVTALWNYAQHFAMSDNAYSDVYGPSTPGAINLISGQTNGMVITTSRDSTYYVHDGQGGLTMIGDAQPAGDSCSFPFDLVTFSGKNIGNLLNEAAVSWGWFEGGFDLTRTNANGTTGCLRSTHSDNVLLAPTDYLPHHEPFQYYPGTANPKHLRPASTAAVGHSGDAANHQYDLRDFFAAVSAGNFPAVSFLKASAFQDGHAGYSDPLDEQTFMVQTVNFLEQRPEWASTAIIILYDDSDGWYDHQMAPVTNASFSKADRLNGPAACGIKGKGATPELPGVAGIGPVEGRCGPGMRQPLLIISPWARANFVDHTVTTQSSVLRFIEDNWLGGKRIGGGSFDATAGTFNAMFDFTGAGTTPVLFLDDTLGTPVTKPSGRTPQ
ncbi:MAG: phospholipase C [Gemmatimonadales bacterium]